MWPIATDGVAWSVSCVSHQAKTDEPIKMPLGGRPARAEGTIVVVHTGATWQIRRIDLSEAVMQSVTTITKATC